MTSPSNPTRRRMLKRIAFGGAALSAGGLVYSLKRGIRYPTLGLEPRPLDTRFSSKNGAISLVSKDIIELLDGVIENSSENADESSSMSFRAFSPEPILTIRATESSTNESSTNKSATKPQRLYLTINNISADAAIKIDTANVLKQERFDGINRLIELDLPAGQAVQLSFHLPYNNDFKFASIGDSGGHHELEWCIKRAHDLGAKFLLHLGDFNYQEGDYERSIELFHNSPIPCYISIGNHDFHDNGVIYPQFLSQLGPLNHAFTIGKTRFVNIDTAASMLPYGAGKRGVLLDALVDDNASVVDTVSFTHRPLHDPQEGSTHDIGSEGERDWLLRALKRIESKTLLSGHIHIYDRSEFMGIDNIIAGQGLGHQDILTNSDYSKIVIGEVASNGKVSFKPEPLSMPMGLHCHPRSQPAKDSVLEHNDSPTNWALLKTIEQSCIR